MQVEAVVVAERTTVRSWATGGEARGWGGHEGAWT
jgi:hypothetical protein